MLRTISIAALLAFAFVAAARAEDGYRLWLRYDKLPAAERAVVPTTFTVTGVSETAAAIRDELEAGLGGLSGRFVKQVEARNAGLVVVTSADSKLLAGWRGELPKDPDGYRIRTVGNVVYVASRSETGALYGTFHYLRLLQTGRAVGRLDVVESPKIKLRMLNHWDNPDGSIERGYAGKSLWNWAELPSKVDPRLRDYARANASVGINATVLNNVNASSQILTPEYIAKVRAIAGAFRPYGVKVFLSARFSAPIEIGGLKTADPFDDGVKAWWKAKADEIYASIPDFGGFLVKANSEGQPGPRTYGRNHVDGANMMAEALAPHGGVVIWRAFVYDMKPGYDRAGAAYENLQPFDGRFAPNAILQVKNGPIDFQPREPFHPLFGAMPRTNMAPEFQITQEYLGFSNHFAYLAEMWKETLDADTFAKGKGSTVARVADGTLFGAKLTAVAGVANTGNVRNWTGHDLLQANWYAFGRLAWNHDLSSDAIAREWIAMTLTRDARASAAILGMMHGSREMVVDYMTPLGLHHQMWGGHHYGPAPWWNSYDRADWNPVYYNKADKDGIGFDRTATGSGTVEQYFPPVRDRFSNLQTVPDELLLWFHHVGWKYRMRSGRTLWNELALRYQRGVRRAAAVRLAWQQNARGAIDAERFAAVSRRLDVQLRDAIWWKDASLSYFQSLSGLPLPRGVDVPVKTLDEYKKTDLLDDFARGPGGFDENHK